MACRYARLVLQAPLNAMPQNYAQILPQFDGIGPVTSQQHIDKINDFSDLEEVDDDDVKIRLFSKSLMGEVKKWYSALLAGSITDLPQFHQIFLNR